VYAVFFAEVFSVFENHYIYDLYADLKKNSKKAKKRVDKGKEM